MISSYELNKAKQGQRFRNRQSNGFGKNFEKFVAMGCDFYREKGIADISKVDEPFRVVRLLKDGRFEGRFTRKANPDFEGTIRGGRSICFECKYTSKDRILQSVITKRQAEVLDRKLELGGLVLLLVVYFANLVWWIVDIVERLALCLLICLEKILRLSRVIG